MCSCHCKYVLCICYSVQCAACSGIWSLLAHWCCSSLVHTMPVGSAGAEKSLLCVRHYIDTVESQSVYLQRNVLFLIKLLCSMGECSSI